MTKNILLTEIKKESMVSNIEIYPLIHMVWNLATIQHSTILASSFAPTNFKVKGEKGLMDYLGACYEISERLSHIFPELSNIRYEIGNWMTTFDQEYADPKTLVTTKSVDIVRKDAQALSSDIDKWWTQIYEAFDKPNTKLLNEKELRVTIRNLFKKLDVETKRDLKDGYDCLVNNIPTPAVMVLYRVGEAMVKKFYKQEMGVEPTEDDTMGTMARDLREKQRKEIEEGKRKKADPLVNYISSQTEERNFAHHPGGRYDQTEAERVFIFVEKLINDIHERLEK